jgi:tRNA threonylcarbamoyladenosine biosynthesis protein TsaE
VACHGPLGAGKTTFVQGFAAGLGVGPDAYVRSPTFALVHVYHGCLPLYHFDFYRLSLASEVQGIGFEDYSEASGVMIIEWAEKFPELLPNARLDVYIDIIDTDKRVIQWSTSADVYSRYFL